MSDVAALHDLLRTARIERGLTQQELADALDMSQRWVSSIERGEVGTPKLRTLHRVAEVLHLSLSDLVIAARLAFTPDEAARVIEAAKVDDPAVADAAARDELRRILDELDPRKLRYALRTMNLIHRSRWSDLT